MQHTTSHTSPLHAQILDHNFDPCTFYTHSIPNNTTHFHIPYPTHYQQGTHNVIHEKNQKHMTPINRYPIQPIIVLPKRRAHKRSIPHCAHIITIPHNLIIITIHNHSSSTIQKNNSRLHNKWLAHRNGPTPLKNYLLLPTVSTDPYRSLLARIKNTDKT